MTAMTPAAQEIERMAQSHLEPGSQLEVVVLGGAAMDWVAQVESLPARDGLALAHTCTRFPGGSAANVAVGIARLGHSVGFAGKLGDDDSGRSLLRAFEQERVEAKAIVLAGGQPTATCFIGLDARGERVIFALPGESLIETLAELDLSYVGGAKVLYIGPAYTAVATAAAFAARERGATVFYAPGGAWGKNALADIRPVLDLADVLLLSRTEAAHLTGQRSPEEAIRSLVKVGVPVVIETVGQQGAWLSASGDVCLVPAFDVPRVRDTTGAGDAFAAGLVAGYLEGLGWEASARQGSACAALKIQQIGARSGLPAHEDLDRFLSSFPEGGRL
jgi:sugar/nucleoside kinase (ribokinase family)